MCRVYSFPHKSEQVNELRRVCEAGITSLDLMNIRMERTVLEWVGSLLKPLDFDSPSDLSEMMRNNYVTKADKVCDEGRDTRFLHLTMAAAPVLFITAGEKEAMVKLAILTAQYIQFNQFCLEPL